MTNIIHDIGVAKQIGTYSDAVEVPPNVRWLYTSGTPGLLPDGTLPADITGQAELAWAHIIAKLKSAGMTVHDLVKITNYLVRAEDIPAYSKVRQRFLDGARPASMLMVVTELPRPNFLVEIDACAAKADAR